jgi:four helix bundle protein
MKTDNIIRTKSYDFAIKIVQLYRKMVREENEYVLSKQLVRYGTSIGANIEEAIGGQSERDFIARIEFLIKKPWKRIIG